MALAFLLTRHGRAADPADAAAVEDALFALAAAGRAAWPALALEPSLLVRHLTRHLPDGEPVLDWLHSLRAEDLHLACACANQVPGAIEALDRQHLAQMASWLARLRPSATFVEEVRQSLRERLFVSATGAPPKIADYAGRGAIASWLRVSAVRLAIDLQRHNDLIPVISKPDRDDAAPPSGSPNRDPEQAYLKERYRVAFEEAFRTAVAGLTSEQCNLLTLHFVDGLTLDQVASLFRVHRATGARWIAAARDAILQGARGALHERLGVSDSEFDSIAGLVRSQLDLSIAGLLREGR